MRTSQIAAASAAFAVAAAQRPSDVPICDYYTEALLEENSADNQYTLLTLLVNTVVIGNCKSTTACMWQLVTNMPDTEPNVGVAVPGILAPGTVNGEDINLLPYFNGELKSTNRRGEASSVNFLDDGGAEPLLLNMPANTEDSRQ